MLTMTKVYSVRVIDGDTVEAMIEVWEGTYIKSSIRILGTDAPEIKTNAGKLVKRMVEQWIVGNSIRIEYHEKDKYSGRFLGDILKGPERLSEYLLSSKYARPYQGGLRQRWSDQELLDIESKVPMTSTPSTELIYIGN